MRNLSLLLAALLSAVAAVALWVWFDRPVPVAESWEGPVSSVSFAPFRRGQSPLTKVYPTSQQIEQDLQSLVGRTRGVRTYTSEEGMEVVPDMAAKLGLKVIFSAWLTNETEAKGKKLNDAEIDGLIKAANAHPNEIERVIVGNEVLLRRDLKPEELIAYIRKVKAAVKQPVSYADVWAFYLKYPEVAKEVDFITIHILPFWEDEPEPIDNVDDYMVRIVERMRATFPGKPILIGESGWPTRGRDRGPAAANMVEGARFVRTLAKLAHERGFDYNVVEAFDQPWKAKMEGTVGANWGVVDGHRRVKYTMSGPVQENQDWPIHAAISVLLGAAATVWALMCRGVNVPVGRSIILALFAQFLAALTVWQAINAWWLGYDFLGDALAILRIGLHAWMARALFKAAAAIAVTDGAISGIGVRLVPFYGACAVLSTVLLLVHGRYRDIPNLEFLIPCFGVLAYGLLRMAHWRLGWKKAYSFGSQLRDLF